MRILDQTTKMSGRFTFLPSHSTVTIGQFGEAVMTSGPFSVAMMVSSLFVPVMDGFHANGWLGNTKPAAVGEPLRARRKTY